MTNAEKLNKAVEIFKTELKEAKGKFRAYVSETNPNEVKFYCESGYYCTINIKSGKIKDL